MKEVVRLASDDVHRSPSHAEKEIQCGLEAKSKVQILAITVLWSLDGPSQAGQLDIEDLICLLDQTGQTGH